jgi:M6 family metalloprotease-like protein
MSTPTELGAPSREGRAWAVLLASAMFVMGPHEARSQEQVTGTLLEIWTDPLPGTSAQPRVDYLIVDDRGLSWVLEVNPGQLPAQGELRSWIGREVTASGVRLTDPRAGPATDDGLFDVESIVMTGGGPLRTHGEDVTGVKRYVTIMCRFAESEDESGTRDLSTYQFWMGEAEPGMGHYWDVVSDGQVDFDGTEVVGWYELPAPVTSYFSDGDGERDNPQWQNLAAGCTSLADADVDFNGVDGINLQFNLRFGSSWGGTSSLLLDGQQRLLGTTWMAAWSGQSVYGHEIGHSFGLPHSSGPYGETYDSEWDVMSDSYVRYDETLSTWIGQQTIGYHKDILGWIGPERKVEVQGLGTTHSIFLNYWGRSSGLGYSLLQIPLEGAEYLTAEARLQEGYDSGVPHQGVVLHRIDETRSRPANVVDADGNGHPNDQGSVWQTGESFNDGDLGITIEVGESTADGLQLEVRFGWQLDLTIEGNGRVQSTPAGVDCTESCKPLFTAPTAFTLSAVETTEFAFSGWAGSCAGTGECAIDLSANAAVTAFFLELISLTADADRPAGLVGAGYEDVLSATGGTGSYGWSLTGGALPSGVRLSGSEGTVSGIPEESGDFQYTVSVSSGPLTADATYTMSVSRPTLVRDDVLDQLLGTGSALSEEELRYLDLIGNDNGRLDVGDVLIFLTLVGQ